MLLLKTHVCQRRKSVSNERAINWSRRVVARSYWGGSWRLQISEVVRIGELRIEVECLLLLRLLLNRDVVLICLGLGHGIRLRTQVASRGCTGVNETK